jgi:hypothetical protein
LMVLLLKRSHLRLIHCFDLDLMVNLMNSRLIRDYLVLKLRLKLNLTYSQA